MDVVLEKDKCLVKDNGLKSQLTQKGFGYKSELLYYIDLFETMYLLERGKIRVIDGNKRITKEALNNICRKEIKDFENKFLVFKEFRDNGYIVKDGLVFGFDFRVYLKNNCKQHSHTEFVVDVKESHKAKEDVSKLIKAERLANTINAKYVMAIVDKEKKIYKIKIEKI